MKKRVVVGAVMLFTLWSAHAQNWSGLLDGLLQKGSSSQASKEAPKDEQKKDEAPSSEIALPVAPPVPERTKPIVKISESKTPYDFKGDQLGMRFDAFMKAHHEPGYWEVVNECTNGKCNAKKLWRTNMSCKEAGQKLRLCHDNARILNDVGVQTSYFFANDALVSIRVSFRYQIPVLAALREGITQKVGPIAYESTDPAFGALTHWENVSSIAELHEHDCLLGSNSTTESYLLGWKAEIAMALNLERCVRGDSLNYGFSHVTYIHKERAAEAIKTIEEGVSDSRKKALSNL